MRRSPPRARAGAPSAPSSIHARCGEGDLFFALQGERADGGEFAARALDAGAWGVVVDHARARLLTGDSSSGSGWVLAADDPLAALQRLATAWRRELGCRVVGITGSVGKTSAKDICRALLPMRVHASRENFNTEIGLPLAILEAPPETEALVLEMAMRGRGQIAQLCEIAEPDVGAITNIGPVHLELLGTMEAIAEAKAEILMGSPTGRAVIPADEEALEPHLHERLVTITFGPGGDVFCVSRPATAARSTPDRHPRRGGRFGSRSERPTTCRTRWRRSRSARAGRPARRDVAADLADNLLAPSGRADRARRGDPRRERLLQRQPDLDARCPGAPGIPRRRRRRVAVLGEMRELGPDAEALPPRDRRARAPARRRADPRGRRARPRLRAGRLGAGRRGCGPARRGDGRARATPSWSRARGRSASSWSRTSCVAHRGTAGG